MRNEEMFQLLISILYWFPSPISPTEHAYSPETQNIKIIAPQFCPDSWHTPWVLPNCSASGISGTPPLPAGMVALMRIPVSCCLSASQGHPHRTKGYCLRLPSICRNRILCSLGHTFRTDRPKECTPGNSYRG